MKTEDTKPWYKQFWPWLLISIPAATAVAGITTIWIASSEPVALVRDDYYKEGLGVNRNLAREREARQRNLATELLFDFDAGWINARVDGDFEGEEIRVAFIHPLQMNRDQLAVLRRQGDGSYQGQLPVDADRWYLQIEGEDQGEDWRLSGEIDLREQAQARLQADGS